MSDRLNKSFVSELDQFLKYLRQTVPKSKAYQLESETERQAYERVAKLRDNVQPPSDPNAIWEDF